MRLAPVAALAGSLSACATPVPSGLPPVSVTATAETEPVGTAAEDAADDPAIWRNEGNPAASLIVATDKKAGLYVYALDGKVKSFTAAGLVNNVALADLGSAGVIVVASDRNDPTAAKLQVYRLDTFTAELQQLGVLDGGAGEAYGVCIRADGAGLRVASVLKQGLIVEQHIGFMGERALTPVGTRFPDRKLATQTEGCVYDPADGSLYVGEENAGIWRFAPEAAEGQLVAPVDNRYLVADVEGLALLREDEQAWLVASSQGDNAYAVFSVPDMKPLGRFRIAAGQFGSAEETDGIELAGGSFSPAFPSGLFVAQDGHNHPHAQNFKLVSWAVIKASLGLD